MKDWDIGIGVLPKIQEMPRYLLVGTAGRADFI
jgi:hypothetical protein